MRRHQCIFCSSYCGEDIALLYTCPTDFQERWREIARRVIDLGVETVEIQSAFDCLDPMEMPRTRDLAVYFLQHGLKVKIFTHLLWNQDHVQRFVLDVVDRCGIDVVLEDRFQIHTSLHGLSPDVMSRIWQCDAKTTLGLLAMLLRNMSWLASSGIYVGVHFVVTRINHRELCSVYVCCVLLGVRMLSLLRLVPHGLAVKNWLGIAMNFESWIDFYQRVLRLLRHLSGLMEGDPLKVQSEEVALKAIHKYLNMLGIDINTTPLRPVEDYPKLRLGCPINWLFKIEKQLKKIDDPLLKVAYRWNILPPPRCSAMLGEHVELDAGGYAPCVAFKHTVRCRDLKELERYRRELFRKWRRPLQEKCHRCPHWTTCLAKCWGQKVLMSWEIDELCTLFDKYGREIITRSYNASYRRDVEKLLSQ